MLVINLYMADDLVTLVTGARQIERKEEAPELFRMVENLAITAGLPMPRLYIVPDDSPNAFAAGRTPKQAIVAVTTGLLERLDEEELEGVLAHEMSHIRNYDVRLMTWAAVLAGSIALLAQIFIARAVLRRRRPRPRRRREHHRAGRRGRVADPRADRGVPDPGRDQPPPGVRGGRVGGRADALPAGPRVGAARRSRATRQAVARGSATRRSRT